jgi:hypothetical protein
VLDSSLDHLCHRCLLIKQRRLSQQVDRKSRLENPLSTTRLCAHRLRVVRIRTRLNRHRTRNRRARCCRFHRRLRIRSLNSHDCLFRQRDRRIEPEIRNPIIIHQASRQLRHQIPNLNCHGKIRIDIAPSRSTLASRRDSNVFALRADRLAYRVASSLTAIGTGGDWPVQIRVIEWCPVITSVSCTSTM